MKDVEVFSSGERMQASQQYFKELFGLKREWEDVPGVTRAPVRYQLGSFTVIDLPGIGFRRG